MAEEKQTMYIEPKTGTYWTIRDDSTEETLWECGICNTAKGDPDMEDGVESHMICRGCGQNSIKYPHMFGSCGVQAMCPNCVCLKGPEKEWKDWVESDHEIKELKVNGWDDYVVKKTEGPRAIFSFIAFAPYIKKVKYDEVDDEAEYKEMREEEAAQREYYGGDAQHYGIDDE